jgi:hypothetical protein
VHTFKYLGILLETTPNLDSVMEHLIVANRWHAPKSLVRPTWGFE